MIENLKRGEMKSEDLNEIGGMKSRNKWHININRSTSQFVQFDVVCSGKHKLPTGTLYSWGEITNGETY
jgi:hypothetical protein